MATVRKLFVCTKTVRCSTGISLPARNILGRVHQRFTPVQDRRCQFRTCTAAFDATKLLMPAYSPTMTEGTIVKWLKKEGDHVHPGDVLCELKTDKAIVSFEADEEAILAKIIMPEGSENVPVGVPIAMLVEDGDDWKGVEIPSDTSPTTPVTSPTPSQSMDTSLMQKIWPSVRKLLEEYSVKSGDVTPTGRHGNLLKSDVLEHITTKNISRIDLLSLLESSKKQSSHPHPPAQPPQPAITHGHTHTYTDTPITQMRATIAKRLSQSKSTIPHAYANIKCRMTGVTKLRKKLADDGIKVSVNDVIVKAVAASLQKVPQVNMIWKGDKPVLSHDIDICVAVATDGGLIAPIVPSANRLGLQEISAVIQDLATRARSGRLKVHEYQGGSFSISNLGMYGITHFTAVINPPQCAILAVGSTQLTFDPSSRPTPVMCIQLSHDARVIDEITAATFLDTLRDFIENPSLLSGT